MKKSGKYFIWACIVFGLIIKLFSLSFNGIFDIDTYYEWGFNSLRNGLNEGYQGTYFPFQYQLFEAGAWIADTFNIGHHTGFKILNLIFDIANLVILYLIFRKLKISKYYLLLYWIHPWFLIMFSQGYCDLQFTFFILCAFYFTLNGTARSYLLSGLFLGLAMHMKPQVHIIVLSIFLYSLYLFYKNRDKRLLHMFVFPTIIFVNYSLYFFIQSGNPFILLRDFVDLPEAMPLTANFLNAWFTVAYFLIKPGDPINSIHDNISIAGIGLRTFALIILLLLIILFIRRLLRIPSGTKNKYDILLLGSFATFIFPFIMTEAHENHLFLATVLLVIISGKIKNIFAIIFIHLLLLLQCINLYGLYGFGEGKILNFISFSYNYEIALVLSLIAFIAFLYLVIYFLSGKLDFLTSFDHN
jgi:hypothetical protein